MVQKYAMNSITTNIKEIPEAWIYKYYAEKSGRPINLPFDGRIIKIRSFVNRDTDPSFCIYYNSSTDKYLWYDHSVGKGGDVIDFVSGLLSKTYTVAIDTILKDYDKFIDEGGNLDEYDNTPIEIDTSFKGYLRKHTFKDLDFWQRFKINSACVHKFNVFPLDKYDILKNGQLAGTFQNFSFGFYSNQHGLYQIYQPEDPKIKYLNTKKDYLIGQDQLRFNQDVCVITSGLKDAMALDCVGLALEVVAPKSENTYIKYDIMEMLKAQYKHVICILDNDEPGLRAMKTYEKIYGIPYIQFTLSQDLAKNSQHNSLEFLRAHYAHRINKTIQDG